MEGLVLKLPAMCISMDPGTAILSLGRLQLHIGAMWWCHKCVHMGC